MNGSLLERCTGSTLLRCLWIALVVVGVSVAAVRIVTRYADEPRSDSKNGMIDFHNGVYYPALSWRQGVSPYGTDYVARYPVARQLPAMSPLVLLVHTPLTWLPLHAGEVVYFVAMLAMVVAIGLLTSRDLGIDSPWACLPIVALVLFSRGGHITLYNGYFTFEMVLASLLTLYWSDRRPWLAAVALAYVSCKPNYFLPLLVLVVARGNLWLALRGFVIAGVAAVLGFAKLYALTPSGIAALLADLRGAQDTHMAEPMELPIESWTRVDLMAVVSKATGVNFDGPPLLVAMVIILAIPCYLLWRQQQPRSMVVSAERLERKSHAPGGHARLSRASIGHITGIAACVTLASLVVSVYHHAYDTLLLVPPLVGLVHMITTSNVPAACSPRAVPQRAFRPIAMTAAILLLWPQVNLLSTSSVLERIDSNRWIYQIITSSNAVAISVALALLCVLLAKDVTPKR